MASVLARQLSSGPEYFHTLTALLPRLPLSETRLPLSEAQPPQASSSGYLVKQGEKIKNWKRRYFRVEGDKLRWFNSEEDAERGRSLGEISMVGHCDGGGRHVLTIKGSNGRLLLVRNDLAGAGGLLRCNVPSSNSRLALSPIQG